MTEELLTSLRKYSLLLLTCAITLFCQGQNKAHLTFSWKKDTARKFSFDLPLRARVRIPGHHRMNVLLLKTDDSVLTGLKYMFENGHKETDKESLAYLNYRLGFISLAHKTLSEEELAKQLDSLEKTVYKDTLRLRLTTVKKIIIPNTKPKKIAYNASCCLLSLAIGGLGGFVIASAGPAIALSIGFAGLAGSVACFVWLNHITHYIFKPQRWYIMNKSNL